MMNRYIHCELGCDSTSGGAGATVAGGEDGGGIEVFTGAGSLEWYSTIHK